MNKFLSISITLLAILVLAGCSDENDPSRIDPSDTVELGVTVGVSLTKSAITGGNDAQNDNKMQYIAVRATGNSTSYPVSNSYAIYKQSSGSWSSEGSDKIMLTSEIASIYAYYPAYTNDANGNLSTASKLETTGTLGTDAKISISIFEGGDTNSGSPATLKANSTITDADNASTGSPVLSAPGEVDYMWEGSSTRPTASNGKTNTTIDEKVDLNMKHALSMVSFRIYNDGTYKNTGKLTKIKLDNSSGTEMKKGAATMDIQDGTVAVSGTDGAVFTRFINASNNSEGITIATSADNSHRYSILVFPTTETTKKTVRVTFTIDGADYPVALPDAAIAWEAGKNYLYTATLSGKALSIQSVKVAAWDGKTGGSIPVN